jgi:hypothetical protein
MRGPPIPAVLLVELPSTPEFLIVMKSYIVQNSQERLVAFVEADQRSVCWAS